MEYIWGMRALRFALPVIALALALLPACEDKSPTPTPDTPATPAPQEKAPDAKAQHEKTQPDETQSEKAQPEKAEPEKKADADPKAEEQKKAEPEKADKPSEKKVAGKVPAKDTKKPEAKADEKPEPTTKGDEKSEPQYSAWLQSAGKYAVGKPGVVTAVLVAKGEWKCNDNYPYKVKLNAPPAGVSFASNIARGASVSKARTTVSVPFTPSEAGTKTISGKFFFSVCNESTCKIQKAPLSVTVNVGES